MDGDSQISHPSSFAGGLGYNEISFMCISVYISYIVHVYKTCVVQITLNVLVFLWIFAICSLAKYWTLLRSISKSLLCIRMCISFFLFM